MCLNMLFTGDAANTVEAKYVHASEICDISGSLTYFIDQT